MKICSKVCSILLCTFLSCSALCAEPVNALTSKGESISGPISLAGPGSWRVGPNTYAAKDLVYIRFSADLPPPRVDSGVFLRGGSLLTGSLINLIGDNADLSTSAFGALKIKRDDLAGAFVPPPSGQAENLPVLAHYSGILGAALGTYGSLLTPGKTCRVRFMGLDEMNAEKVMRVGSEQMLLTTKGKAIETVSRQFVRMLELVTPPLTAVPDDDKLGPLVVVRLKAGDLLCGRVTRLNDQALTLKTNFMGERDIPRALLAAAFLYGAPLNQNAGLTWLSSIAPEKSIHTPVFDAEFPARMDASVDGNDLRVQTLAFERGIGVHSKSELVYALDGAPRRFVAVAGIDNETLGRGGVLAKVLADGKELWSSGEMSAKDAPKTISVDLSGAKSLTLLVNYGADNDDSGDHFDWGWACVIRKD